MAAPKAAAILVVDDNAALREAIARSLTRRGYQVTIAVDAVEGWSGYKARYSTW